MLLNLKPIMEMPGVIPFSFDLDLSGLEINYHFPAVHPVSVSGEAVNRAGALELRASAHTVLELVCDRCLRPYAKDWRLDFAETLSENGSGRSCEEYIPIVGDSVDLDAVIRSAFILDMELKWLCGEDCQGLCYCCGANLNEGKCDCPHKDIDPRLSLLGALLPPVK